METRGIYGFLRVHAEPGPVENSEQRGRDDARAAWRAGDETEFAVAENDRGNHGAERAMSGGDGVGFRLQEAEHIGSAGLAGEIVHFIVEKKTVGRGDGGAITVVERVSVCDGVTGGVHD